jgi:hypothetical protein
MKSRLIILFLLVCFYTQAQERVPDTDDFSLQDVYDAVSDHANPSSDLQSCFDNAEADYFNSNYEEDKNELDDFRDYRPPEETVETFTSSGTWTCPSGVDSITAECWGAGGAGGAGAGDVSNGGGGGGGAGYVRATYTVTPGETYSYTVGLWDFPDGGDSEWNFDDDYYITAGGGEGGDDYYDGASGGGTKSNGWFTQLYDVTEYEGGSGADGAWGYSGGGGGGAGSTGNGKDASGTSGGGSTSEYGGTGGDGTYNANTRGEVGSYYGGGTGGSTGNADERTGTQGFIRITYW